jgi:RNA polymerase sigma factor (sigma-70 family)
MLFLTYRGALREPMLDPVEERAAIAGWQDNHDMKALELLLRSHARQAWAQASKWTQNPTHLEDLVAEGMIGRMRAADNFDRRQEVRFGTYSAWWVMNGIATALARIKSVIDVPTRTYLAARGGKLSDAEQQRVRMATQGTIALDAPLSEGARSATDTIVSEELNPEEHAAAESLHTMQIQLLTEALETLEPREAEIIRRRRLQAVADPLETVAADMNMSLERLRQYESRAMLRLRRRLIDRGFSPAMLT